MIKRISAVLLALCASFSFSGCSKNEEIKLGTGDSGGSYYLHGTELAKRLEDEGVSLKVRETAGSVANIRLIDGGYVDLAFVQSDTLRDAHDGTGMFKEARSGYSAVAGLYTEACQLVAASDSGIYSISDLYGMRVSVGEEESGVLQNAMQIIDAYGLDDTDIKPRYLSFTDSAKALKSGEIDAFFCTAGVPTAAVTELADSADIRLIPIDAPVADRIIGKYGGYTKYTIDAGTYKGQDKPVDVLGVKTVLIARDSLPNDIVKKITGALFTSGDKPGLSESEKYATEDIPIPFHKGAEEYYSDHGINFDESREGQ